MWEARSSQLQGAGCVTTELPRPELAVAHQLPQLLQWFAEPYGKERLWGLTRSPGGPAAARLGEEGEQEPSGAVLLLQHRQRRVALGATHGRGAGGAHSGEAQPVPPALLVEGGALIGRRRAPGAPDGRQATITRSKQDATAKILGRAAFAATDGADMLSGRV